MLEGEERGDEPPEAVAVLDGPARRSMLKKSSKAEFNEKLDCNGLSTSMLRENTRELLVRVVREWGEGECERGCVAWAAGGWLM